MNILRLALLGSVFLANQITAADVPTLLQHTIYPTSSGLQEGAMLGRVVATDGTYAAAAAPEDDTGGFGAGVVRVFNVATGQLLHSIPNPTPTWGGRFGSSFALANGILAVLGADPYFYAGNNGAVYLYRLSGPTPIQPVAILSGNQFGSNFLSGIAMTQDWLAITGFNSVEYSVYVFDIKNLASPRLSRTLRPPVGSAKDSFGSALALSGDRLVAGALTDSSDILRGGAAFVFNLAGTEGPIELKNPAPSEHGLFGRSVAISGTTLVVAASGNFVGGVRTGAAYIYDLAGAAPDIAVREVGSPTPGAYRGFGTAVCLTNSELLVTEPSGSNAVGPPSVHIFERTTNPLLPAHSLTLAAPDGFTDEGFGTSASLSGNTVLIGAPHADDPAQDAGAAYLFDMSGLTPAAATHRLSEAGPLGELAFGTSIDTDGSRFVVGAPGDSTGAHFGGSAFLHDYSSAEPEKPVLRFRNPIDTPGDRFGQSIGLESNLVAIGADGASDYSGAVVIFDLDGTEPEEPACVVANPAPAPVNFFGRSIGLSGTKLIAGSKTAVHVFDLDSLPTIPPPLQLQVPTQQGGVVYLTAISGRYALVGATSKAYLYDLEGANPASPIQEISHPDGYGFSAVAIDATRMVLSQVQFFSAESISRERPGRVFLYQINAAGSAQFVTAIQQPPNASGFGANADVQGSLIAVGSNKHRSLRGGSGTAREAPVYVYDLSQSASTPAATLYSPMQAAPVPALGEFGLVVGEPEDSSAARAMGSVSVFTPAQLGLAPQVQFLETEYVVLQEDLQVRLRLSRTGGSGPASLEIALSGLVSSGNPPFDPAGFGSYFPSSTINVEFAEGQSEKEIFLFLASRQGYTYQNSQIRATLQKPRNGTAVGTLHTATVRIIAADATNPALVVQTPAATATSLSTTVPFMISGTASDSRGINRVELMLNGVLLDAAELGNPTPTKQIPWSAQVTPAAGSNTLVVTAYDLRGNSTSVTRSFNFTRRYELAVARAVPAGVAMDNVGAVALAASNSNPRTSAVVPGTTVKFTATAKPGYVFSHWDNIPAGGSALGPVLSFTMPSADVTTVVANFVANPFVGPVGSSNLFYGLIHPEGATPSNNSTEGFFTCSLTPSNGSFTGKVFIDGVSQSCRGCFYGNGDALFTVGTTKTYTLTFGGRQLSLYFAAGVITAEVTKSTNVSSGLATRGIYSATNKVPADLLNQKTVATAPANNRGFFTIGFPSKVQDPVIATSSYPQGDGFGTITISDIGIVSVSGTLADGTAITGASGIVAGNMTPIFVQLTTPGAAAAVKGGSFGGVLTFDTTETETDVAGTDLRWFRPTVTELSAPSSAAAIAATKLYTVGWPAGINVDAAGALYDKTLTVEASIGAPAAAAGVANAQLMFSEGKLVSGISKLNLNITGNVAAKIPTTDMTYTLTLAAATGGFSGGFAPNWASPSTTKPAFKGILIQKGPVYKGGYGYFLSNIVGDSDPESGWVTLGKQP